MSTRDFSIACLFAFPSVLLAQDDCADLTIAGIHYTPFNDTIVEVRVVNSNGGGFGYPSLILYDESGDTLAWAPADFFGIGQDQTFLLPLAENANVPTGFFDAKVEVWTGFNSTLACTFFPPYTILCPFTECTEVYPSVLAANGDGAGHEFAWDVADENGTNVASGSMVIPEGQTQTNDTVCLPPGNYTLSVINGFGSVENVWFHMAASVWNAPSSPQVEVESGEVSPFTLNGACIAGTNAVAELDLAQLEVSVVNSVLRVARRDGAPIGAVEVMDAAGRLVLTTSSQETVVELDLGDLSPGVLVVKATDMHGVQSCRRIAWVMGGR